MQLDILLRGHFARPPLPVLYPPFCEVQGGPDACVPCRVKVMAELLRGIHQIKMCVWEQGFVAKVCRQYNYLVTSGTYVLMPPRALAT